MPPSIAPAPFYGDNRVSDEFIRQLRLSRLISIDSKPKSKLMDRKQSKPKFSVSKPRFSGVKLFSGVGHNIQKPKLRKLKELPKEKKRLNGSMAKVSVRQMMRDKFDFTRTPYATPKRTRVAISDETSKKRKFFKTTVETPEPKTAKLDEQVAVVEFEDVNDMDEEPFANIRKDVSNILTDWLDDEEYVKPHVTRQRAGELDREVSNSNLSYLTPSIHKRVVDNTRTTIRTSTDTPDRVACAPSARTTTADTPNAARAELYSIFTPPSKNVLSDVTNRMKKSQSSLNRAAASSDQYQIDAGQKIIGPKECPVCGMVYDIGDPIDVKRHVAYHAKRNELKYKGSRTETVVGIVGTDRIILMKYADEKKRKKVEEILRVTEEDIGSGYTFGSLSVAFLYVRNDHILGCLIAEPKTRANRVIKSDDIVLLSETSESVKCGINRIWVKQECRGQNIATEMMNCLRKNFGYGEFLKIEDIAFSTTTADGHRFARKYTGRDDYLTYLDPNMN